MGTVWGAFVAGFAVLSMFTMPAQAAATNEQHDTSGPDLKISLLEASLGKPARAVVGTDGVVGPIEVRVVTENDSDVGAGASTTVALFQDSSRHQFLKAIAVPPLGPQATFDRTVEITGAKPKLGFALIGAKADSNEQVDESDETNNLKKGERFSIIAKQWNVSDFQTIVKPVLGKSVTVNGSGFHFELEGYDHAAEEWLYHAYGPVLNLQNQNSICSYSGSKTMIYRPWPNAYLRISGDLGGYRALVKASDFPSYPIKVTCLGGFTYTYRAQFSDLETYDGVGREPTMSPSETELEKATTDPALRTIWRWDFKAAVS